MQPSHHSHHRLGQNLFIFGAFTLLILAAILVPVSSGDSKAFGTSDIINGSNQARDQLNQPPLNVDLDLMSGAQMKAEDMAKGHFFAHVAPDGTVAWDYFKKVGYNYEVAGENLAITNEGSDAVIKGWLNSKTHRDNLLNSQYTDMGIGMAPFGDYDGHKNTYVIVAFYGKRSALQVLTAPTTPAGGTTNFKAKPLPVSPVLVGSIAAMLMLAGITLEILHIRKLHHLKTITQ